MKNLDLDALSVSELNLEESQNVIGGNLFGLIVGAIVGFLVCPPLFGLGMIVCDLIEDWTIGIEKKEGEFHWPPRN